MATVSALSSRDAAPSDRYFDPGTALNRVMLEAPYLARCSDNKSATLVRPRQYAVAWPYMQVNRPGMVSWMVFDLDHSNAWIWEDASLPAPNLIVRDRNSGRAHLFYAIPPVCTTALGRARPIAYFKAVYEAMAKRLQADLDFHGGPVAKTPGHPWWSMTELHAHEYSLAKLAEYVELASPARFAPTKGPRLQEASQSRHCTLFELMRFYAYSEVTKARTSGSYEDFQQLLETYGLSVSTRVNELTAKTVELRWSEIRATAKSVARWTWERWRGSADAQRGVMQLDKGLTLEERQQLSALRTHELRTKQTELRIGEAVRKCVAAGFRVTQAAIARATGLSRQTVANYKAAIEAALTPVDLVVVASTQAPVGDVQYGVHQIAAGLSEPSFGRALRAVSGDEGGICLTPHSSGRPRRV